jgi:hypothetical protein
MKVFVYLIYLSIIVASFGAAIANTKSFKNIAVNIGSWQEYYMQVQEEKDGELNGFELRPYFSIASDYSLPKNFSLIPEAGYVLRENIGDSSLTKDIFFLRTDLAYKVYPNFQLRVGTSIMWITYSGDGSEKSLPNGNGEQTYYSPSERRNVMNQTLDFGIEYFVEKTSLRLQSYIYSADKESERLNSISLSINYLFPVKDL